jgi:hypothetical protein
MHLFADLAMVALLGFLKVGKVFVEFGLGGEGSA